MTTLKDCFNTGENYESPNFQVSHNLSKNENSGTSATIDFKLIYGDPVELTAGGLVPNDVLNKVHNLAYSILRDSNKLSITLNGELALLKSISARPIAGTDVWEISASYGVKDSNKDVEVVMKNITFSTQGRRSHIERSLLTKHAINITGYPYNFGGMIGWNDGEVQGVDVVRPNLTFNRDIWILYNNLNWDIVRAFADMTGSVNSDEFYGFAPGNVLFTGISQGQNTTMKIDDVTYLYWNLTLGFEVSPATVTLEFGTPCTKSGWDYLWRATQKTTLTSDEGRIICKQPYQTNVEQVYPYREFCTFFGFGYTSEMTGDYESVFSWT